MRTLICFKTSRAAHKCNSLRHNDLYLLHICQTLLLSNRLVFDFCCGLLWLGLRRLALWLWATLWLRGAVWLRVVGSPPLAAMLALWLTSWLRGRAVGFLWSRIAEGTRTCSFFLLTYFCAPNKQCGISVRRVNSGGNLKLLKNSKVKTDTLLFGCGEIASGWWPSSGVETETSLRHTACSSLS